MTSRQTDLCFLSIEESSRLIHSGQLSPVELTQAYLDRIEAIDDKVGGYITVLAESALAEAREAEKAITGGQSKGPLHGIPMAHKDLYDTKGVLTTGGSKVFADRVPDDDATVIAKLKEAGTVLLGKHTMSEFAMGAPASLGATPRNPWNLEHTPGGSSSGTGAAVAAALCAGGLGSDTGGSIRGPASLNGIVGMIPTYGRASRYGVLPLSWSLDHAGPLTRTVEDTALMMQAISGHDPKDPTTSTAPVPNFRAEMEGGVRGMKIGVPRHAFTGDDKDVDAETVAAVERAITALAEMGAEVREVHIPGLEHLRTMGSAIFMSEAYTYYQHLLRFPEGGLRGALPPLRLRRRPLHQLRLRAGVAGPGEAQEVGRAGLCGRGRDGDAHLRRACLEAGCVRGAGTAAVHTRAMVHHDLQHDQLPGHLPALRLHPGGAAHRAADRGLALRRGVGAAGGLRLPAAGRVRRDASAGLGDTRGRPIGSVEPPPPSRLQRRLPANGSHRYRPPPPVHPQDSNSPLTAHD